MINLLLSTLIAFLPTTVVSIAETDTSTVIYCTCKVADDAVLPVKQAISHTTRIITEDGSYKLKHTFNMPIWDEADARTAYLTAPGQTLNFALEFEKFPISEPFDLVENESKTGSLCIKNIKASEIGKQMKNPEAFLNATPYSEYGIEYVEGHPSEYYDDGDILIQTSMGAVSQIGNKIYQSAGLLVKNRSGESFRLTEDDISISDADSKPINILKANKANNVWHDMDRAGEVLENGLNAGQIASGAITSASFRYGGDLSLAGLGLGLIVGSASNQVAEKKISEENKIRVEAMSHYFKDATITPAEEYSTFFIVKRNKKKDTLSVKINIKGKTYEFIMN